MKQKHSLTDRPVHSYWHPITAGTALGIVLLLTFLATGHGLGASGAATNAVALLGLQVSPLSIYANAYLAPMVEQGHLISNWMSWEVVGLALGALISARLGGRFRVQTDGQRSLGTHRRLTGAFVGGLLAGFGARVSAGCTSGLGLSGAATMGVAAFVFLALFFATGLLVSRWIRGV